ncbi:MAG TPA: hypothetical protein VG146_13195 [Verrucomicrobiae bacterium]|nr:hypothetical protein [Verrucomicrobiae bacterium]
MITLAADCLIFEMANGEGVPFSSDMISIELTGQSGQCFEPDFVRHAAKAVFHFFKHELGRQTVSVAEFAEALEKVLRGFNPLPAAPLEAPRATRVVESDLFRLARDSGQSCELLFFPLLREALRQHLRQSPRLLRFHGLRGCVKQLAGARRWTPRCQGLEEQIVAYLRECLNTPERPAEFALLIE